jgi:hypothetical protein
MVLQLCILSLVLWLCVCVESRCHVRIKWNRPCIHWSKWIYRLSVEIASGMSCLFHERERQSCGGGIFTLSSYKSYARFISGCLSFFRWFELCATVVRWKPPSPHSNRQLQPVIQRAEKRETNFGNSPWRPVPKEYVRGVNIGTVADT